MPRLVAPYSTRWNIDLSSLSFQPMGQIHPNVLEALVIVARLNEGELHCSQILYLPQAISRHCYRSSSAGLIAFETKASDKQVLVHIFSPFCR